MENELKVGFADIDDINTIGYIAQQTWPIAYGSIISMEQIDYMLKLFYSPASLTDQIQKQKHQFILAGEDDEPLGFASYSAYDEPGIFKLHKIYVLPESQGKGVGKALLDFVVDKILRQ